MSFLIVILEKATIKSWLPLHKKVVGQTFQNGQLITKWMKKLRLLFKTKYLLIKWMNIRKTLKI